MLVNVFIKSNSLVTNFNEVQIDKLLSVLSLRNSVNHRLSSFINFGFERLSSEENVSSAQLTINLN